MAVSAIEQKVSKASPMRLGMVLFLLLFGSLFWAYYYLRALTPGWPPQHPEVTLAGVNTFFLLSSSGAIWLGIRAIKKGSERGLLAGSLATAILGTIFLGITAWEWTHEVFRPWTNAYGSVFYTLTGFHALHVFGGVLLMLALMARTVRHRFTAQNYIAADVGSLYWHFVDFIWILVFTTIFIIR